MSKSHTLLAQAQQFMKINADKISTATRKYSGRAKMAKITAGFSALRKAITSRKFLASGVTVVTLMGAVFYTQTIGLSAWLAEKALNLPANVIKIAAGLVTLPFALVERAVKTIRKQEIGRVTTAKPFYALNRAIDKYKDATNYVCALYVRAAMSPTFRLGMKTVFITEALYAVFLVLTGLSVTTAITAATSALFVVFLGFVGTAMALMGLEEKFKLFTRIGNAISRGFHFLFDAPAAAFTKAMRKVFVRSNWRDAQIEELRATIDLLKAERDFAYKQAEEAEQAALIFKNEAEKLRKQANGYVKKDGKHREPRKSGNPAVA